MGFQLIPLDCIRVTPASQGQENILGHFRGEALGQENTSISFPDTWTAPPLHRRPRSRLHTPLKALSETSFWVIKIYRWLAGETMQRWSPENQPITGHHAVNKLVLERTWPLPSITRYCGDRHKLDCLKLQTGCWEPKEDSFWTWLACEHLPGSPSLADKTINLSYQKSRIQRELPRGTKLFWNECHYTFF